MPSLQQLETDAQLEVPRDIGGAIKTLAADPRYAKAWNFILGELCGRNRLSFVPNAPEPTEFMIWREGRRFVGEMLARIADTPLREEPAPEPPARSMTAKAERRAHRGALTKPD